MRGVAACPLAHTAAARCHRVYFLLPRHTPVLAQMPKIVLPIYCEPRLNYHEDRGTVSVMVGAQSMPTLSSGTKGGPQVEDISIHIPLPKGVQTADLEANVGKHLWDQGSKC